MKVYADMIFFVNFLVDLEILITLTKLYRQKIRFAKLLLSACLGGMQGVFAFVPYFRILSTAPARLLMPFFMIWAVFYPCKLTKAVKGGFFFLPLSFIISGAVIFFDLSSAMVIFMPLPVFIAVNVYINKKLVQKRNVTLIYNDCQYHGEGFYDSGNMLFYKNLPVILAIHMVFEDMFGKEFSINAVNEWVNKKDIRIIPYTSLGNQGAVIGISLDKAVVDGEDYYGIILGYCTDKFSENLILNGIMT